MSKNTTTPNRGTKKVTRGKNEGVGRRERVRSKHERPFDTYIYSQKYAIAFDYYSDPKSETFDNAYKSALKAGFPESSAKVITATKWWKHEQEMLEELLPLAERNIKDILTMDVNAKRYDPETGEVIAEMLDPKLLRIKSDMSTFVAETRGNKRYNKKIKIEDTTAPVVEKNPEIKAMFSIGFKPNKE